ncbi:hypothetical protein IP88_01415 [alpha proteobacterium AAP81b]|nr:hypothetical protein IP88_01415 [alpha proteobacterium AAP81b]
MPLRAALAALALLAAAPALAQSPPGPAAMRLQPPMHGEGDGRFARRLRDRMENGLLAGMSPAGRQAMAEALRGNPADRIAEREAVSGARDRMLTLLESERLDVAGLRRAMDDERAAAETTHQRRQAQMLAALQRLSPADRKAFVANARAAKNRMDDRLRAMGARGGMPGEPPPMW